MANSNDSPDAIRRRMAEIRSEMHYEMSQVVAEASSAADWRSYVKARPWMSLGIAFATGYLLVPRRRSAVVPVPVAVVAPRSLPPREVSRKPLLVNLLLGSLNFGGPLLMRIAQGMVLREMENFLEGRPKDSPPRTARSEEPTANVNRVGGDTDRRF